MSEVNAVTKQITVFLALLTCLAAVPPLPATEPGAIQGSVISVDAGGSRTVVPGAKVVLTGEANAESRVEATSDGSGAFRLSPLATGAYRISASTPELYSEELAVTVTSGGTLNVDIELKLRSVQQTVTVDGGSSDTVAVTETAQSRAITDSTLKHAPNSNERFESVLPLIPGVVRGPDGLINMKGARASQSGLLVNSANVTDPVTGNSGINLPIDVVSSVQVISNPYQAEYGKLAGAVAVVDTRISNFSRYHFRLQNFMPRMRKRDGSMVGVESATPRLTVTGPLIRNRLAFTQSLEYRYIRTPVNSLPPLSRDTGLESLDSYTQLDLSLTERQTAFVTVAVFPEKLRYLGLNTFTPQPATPDLHQRGYFLAFSHKYVTASGGLLASQLSYKTLDGDVKPQSDDPYRMEIDTTTGGFYNRQRRDTDRLELQESFSPHPIAAWGQHQLKFGGDFVRNAYDGKYASRPVAVLRAPGALAERIDFSPAASISVRQREYTLFVQDHWTISRTVTLEAGLRADRDSVTGDGHVAPRLGVSYSPFAGGRTVVRGGVGYFYSGLNLNISSFTQLPERTVTTYLPGGSSAGAVTYRNRLAAGLDNPRSTAWNLEIQQQVTPDLILRTGYSQRITVREFFLQPEPLTSTTGALWLSNAGRSRYREFQVTTRYALRKHVMNASYVRSSAIGDLNDFNQFFGNTPNPIIRQNERNRLAFDAPNRFLFWGEFAVPWKITVSPVWDIHTGFPYSIVNEERDFIGARNRGGRFPRFSSTDVQVTKEVSLPFFAGKYKAQVGVRAFNIFNHWNPRDLQTNVGSYRYGSYFNGVDRMLRGKLVVEF